MPPAGIFMPSMNNEVLTIPVYADQAVQGGIPMTVQGESAAPPPGNRPEARRSLFAISSKAQISSPKASDVLAGSVT